VFAHFGSREELQARGAASTRNAFVRRSACLLPCASGAPGTAAAILENWLKLLTARSQQGCLMISGSIEYDDRPGTHARCGGRIIRGWTAELLRAVEDARAPASCAPTVDAGQLASRSTA